MVLRRLIEEYLSEVKFMQLATVKGDRPWVATVWFAFDNDLNLYFISQNFRRHVLDIKNNSNIAGAITKPHKDLGVKVRGIQFEGKASEVSIPELPEIFKLFAKRFPGTKEVIRSIRYIIKNTIKTRFYKIQPSRFVLFDEVYFPENPQQELVLKNR